jgi:hypothetical protein
MSKISIDDLTVHDIKTITSLCAPNAEAIPCADHPYKIGEIYLIRTVTMIQCGRLKRVGAHELVLESASWIPDTGRFADALKDPHSLSEVEPFPDGDVIVGRGAVIDATIPAWSCLPREQK